MVELVYGEGVLVDPPGPVEDVVPEGFQVRVVGFCPSRCLVRVGEPVIGVEENDEARDFEGWDEVALAGPRLPRQGR